MQTPTQGNAGITAIAQGGMGPVPQQNQQEKAPQNGPGMSGLDPKLVAAMMKQYAQQVKAEADQRAMALMAPQPQGTVIDRLLGAQPQQTAAAQRPQGPQGLADVPTEQTFKDGGIVGFAGGGKTPVDDEVDRIVGANDNYRGDSTLYSDAIAKAKEDGRGKTSKDIEKALQVVGAAGSPLLDLILAAPRAVGYLGDLALSHSFRRGNDPESAPVAVPDFLKATRNAGSTLRALRTDERSDGKAAAPDMSAYVPRGTPAAAADAPVTFSGVRVPDAKLAELRASKDPDAIDFLRAYDAWAAQQPAGNAPVNQTSNAASAQDKETPAPAPAPAMRPPSGVEQLLPGALKKALETDSEKVRDAEVERYRKDVGAPDTSVRDAMIAELRDRQKLFAPKEGFMDLLRSYANNAQAGDQWWQTGARGGQALIDANQANALKAAELRDKALTLRQQGIDAIYGHKKDVYKTGLDAKEKADAARDKALTAGASVYHTDKALEGTRYSADKHLEGVLAQLRKAELAQDKAAVQERIADLKALLESEKVALSTLGLKDPAMRSDDDNDQIAVHRNNLRVITAELAKRAGIALPPPTQIAGASFSNNAGKVRAPLQ